jgi:hypothetical protein
VKQSHLVLMYLGLASSIAAPLAACMPNAQGNEITANQIAVSQSSETGKSGSAQSNVEQIAGSPPREGSTAEQVIPREKDDAGSAKQSIAIVQLPGNLEAINGTGPETSIGTESVSPEVRLYEKVAQVWYSLRQRGMQPTPERIAQEIGPDQLARFLDLNPGAGNIFGTDSDTLPVPKPGSSGGGPLIPDDGGK